MLGTPRYIFSINSGRSGSHYLADLLATAPEVASFHETDPKMIGEVLQLVEQHPYPATYDARRYKAAACQALLAAQPGKTVYAETSHMFIKTFFDVIMAEFAAADQPVGIVILRRELARVLKSFIELGMYTDRNPYWPAWMPSVQAHTRAIDPPAPELSLTTTERTIGYLIDNEARAQRFLRDHPAANVYETRLEALGNDREEMLQLFAWAGVTATEESHGLTGKRVNERLRRKGVMAASVSYQECVDAIGNYLGRCRTLGIEVPGTLALESWQG